MSQAASIGLACTAPGDQNGTSMVVGLQVEGLNQTARIPFFSFNTVWLPGLEGTHPADPPHLRAQRMSHSCMAMLDMVEEHVCLLLYTL